MYIIEWPIFTKSNLDIENMAMKKTDKASTVMKLISWCKDTDNSKKINNVRVIKKLKAKKEKKN